MNPWTAALTEGLPRPLESAAERGLARAVWLAMRPAWTQAGWWDSDLRDDVRLLLSTPVGPDLLTALIALEDGPRRCPHPHTGDSLAGRLGQPGAPCACQLVIVAAWDAVTSWSAARADRALVQVAGAATARVPIRPDAPGYGTITDPCIEELATALRVTPSSARNRVARARDLTRFPALLAAVRDGLLVGWHAHLVLQDLAVLPPEAQDTVVDDLLSRLWDRHRRGLRTWTFTEVRQSAKRLAARVDVDLLERRKECHRRRGVRVRSTGPGSASLMADLTDDVAERIMNRVRAISNGLDDPRDSRTRAQKQADVLTDLLLEGHLPADTTDASRGEVAVVVDLDTLLGGAEHPGEVPGCGPVAAEVARTIAADRNWRLWVTDPATKAVITTGSRTYRPSAALARLVAARDPHCRMPGCRATRTDLDHAVPWPAGSTTESNLGRLCRRHHNMKTHGGWGIAVGASARLPGAHDDTGYTWRAPSGLTFTDLPPPPLE